MIFLAGIFNNREPCSSSSNNTRLLRKRRSRVSLTKLGDTCIFQVFTGVPKWNKHSHLLKLKRTTLICCCNAPYTNYTARHRYWLTFKPLFITKDLLQKYHRPLGAKKSGHDKAFMSAIYIKNKKWHCTLVDATVRQHPRAAQPKVTPWGWDIWVTPALSLPTWGLLYVSGYGDLDTGYKD